MLHILKKVFSRGSSAPAHVEPIDFRDGLLRISSKSPLNLREQKVLVETPDGAVETVVNVRSYDGENQVYLAEVPDNLDKESLSEIGVRVDETTRISRILTVSGPELPEFGGFTECLSVGGMRLSTSEILKSGKIYNLTIKLDNSSKTALKIKAKVAWTAHKADGTCHSGLRFQDVDAQTFRTLARFIQTRI